jgi:DNA-binding XRE family transcriptional regulator
MNKPTAQQVKQARKEAGLTQKQAADKIMVSKRSWQYYEAGQREMSAAVWELYKIKTVR